MILSGGGFALPTDNDDILAQALALAGAGIPVFPLHGLREAGGCECPDPGCKAIGKHPTVKGWGDLASTDPGRIEQWFKTGRHNLGIPTGQRSGLVVIDVDPRNGGDDTLDKWESYDAPELPWTLRCRTGSGGLHIFLRVPEGVKIGMKQAVLPGIDIKGEGGLVVGAPSRHKSGDRYRWIDPATEVKFAEGEVLTWLLTVRGNTSHQVGGGSGATPVGYSYESALATGCPAGARDTFFNDLAFRCKAHRGLSQAQALEVVRHHWERAESTDDDSFDWRHAEFKVMRMYSDDNVPLATNQATPEQLVIGQRLVASLASGVQATPVAGQEEVAESTAEVGSSQPPVVGRPPILGQVPELETELTQTGNAHRFVKIFQSYVRFVHGLGWHIWDGSRWRLDEASDAFELTQGVLDALRLEQDAARADDARMTAIRRWRDTSSGMSARQAMLTGAAADSRIKATVNGMNADPWLLVVKNGTIDLRTRQLRASRPEDNNTKCANVTYDAAAECPLWVKHVKLVTSRRVGGKFVEDDMMTTFVQKWVGYSLTGLVKEQKLFFGFGEGNNGKNVLIETVMGLMGDYAMKQNAQLVLGSASDHSTIIADLAGARMVFIDETPKGRVNDSRLKELTGTKKIRARKIAKDSFEFDATFKLWLAGNNKPRVADTTEGFWRRLDLVPFDVEIPAKDRVKDFTENLKAEWSGILNWALEGLRLYELEGLEQPSRVADAVAEYRDDENSFGQFVADTFDVKSEKRVWTPNPVIHGLFAQWCKSQGIEHVPTMRSLTSELHKHGFVADKTTRRVKIGALVEGTEVKRGWLAPPIITTVPAMLIWSL